MKFSYRNASNILLVAFFFLQGTFAFRIVGPTITIQRLFIVILYLWTFSNSKIQKLFRKSTKRGQYTFVIAIYLFVCTYTAILRADFNTIFGVFVDCFLMYLLFLYFLDFKYSQEEIIQLITRIVLIACIFGLIEYVTHFNIFSFLTFATDVIPETMRDGVLRIRVTYGHPLAYGMFLVLFFPFCCYDCANNRIYLFQKPVILGLVMINILLTGSRSSIGIFCVELIIIAILTSKAMKGNLILSIIITVVIGGFVMIVCLESPLIQLLLRQISYVIDEVFGTQIAVHWGGDLSISNSSIARDRLWKIFNYPDLNPLLGLGVSTKKSFFINNWEVTSIDNFYVNQYIKFAYPGLIATIMMFIGYLWHCIYNYFKYHSKILLLCLIAGAGYMVNLLVVDELGTIRFFFFLMAFTRNTIQKSKLLKK